MITLVDLSGMFWPAYYASMNGSDAHHLVTEEIFGYAQSCDKLIVCAEGRRPKRFDWYPKYKANRPEKPQEARDSLVAIISDICDSGVNLVSLDGYEADDLIATFSSQAEEHVQIVSQDKDLAALVSDRVCLIVNRKPFGPRECLAKFGVHPHQIRDYLAICGDAADNIPGCPGIGSKGAARLLQKFGSLESIQAAPDQELGLGPKTLAKFREWDPSLAVKLTTLLFDAPIHLNEIFPTENTMADMSKIVSERPRGPLKILAYGPEGVGKTRFGAFSPKPIFLCAENGLSAPDLKSVPSFPTPDCWADVMSAIHYLKTADHQYQTFVIDSVDWLHQHVRAEICKRENMSPSQYEDFGRGEKHAFELWIQLMRELDSLQDARRMHIVALAHSGMENFPNPQGDDFVRYQLALSKKAAERWKQWPDFLLFLSQEMFTKKSKDDKNAKGIMGDLRIFTQRTAAFDAKNRVNLPAEIEYETANPWRAFSTAYRQVTAPPAQPNNANNTETSAA